MEGYKTIVLLAVADEHVRRRARSYLETGKKVTEGDVIDCTRFIEANCVQGRPGKQYCILCGKSSDHFLPDGIVADVFQRSHIIGAGRREHSICPVCGSNDRARWCFYVLEKYTRIMCTTCTALHFAPEKGISDMIRTNEQCNYITADIEKNVGMIVVDITNIPFRDNTFDYVIVNHVLEHVGDDRRALSEIYRVLKQNGLAVVSFPICLDQNTDEGLSIQTDIGRLIRYGQKDHVRLYGADYKERLEEAGFHVEVKSPKNEMERGQIERFGLLSDDIVILLRK